MTSTPQKKQKRCGQNQVFLATFKSKSVTSFKNTRGELCFVHDNPLQQGGHELASKKYCIIFPFYLGYGVYLYNMYQVGHKNQPTTQT